MKFKDLTLQQRETFKTIYGQFENNREEGNRVIADLFNCSERSVRRWAHRLGLKSEGESARPMKVLIYDIETSRVLTDAWWTGKQYVSHDQFYEEPRVITISWKWLHEEQIYCDRWDHTARAENINGYDVSGWGCDGVGSDGGVNGV